MERRVAENCHEMEPGLFRILLPTPWAVPFTNAWLLQSQGEWALIDCGFASDPSHYALGRAIRGTDLADGGLSHLLLTHGHHDHAGGAKAVKARWGGQVWLHHRDLGFPPLTTARTEDWVRFHGMEGGQATKAATSFMSRMARLPEVVSPLQDNQMLSIGDLRLKVIPVPGHSPGHVMFWETTRGWLFTGDQVLPNPGWNVMTDPWEPGDLLGNYLDSMKRAEAVSCRFVLPGHGAPLQGERLHEACAALNQAHLGRAENLLAHLGADCLSTYGLAMRELPDRVGEPMAAGYAISTTLVALIHLQQLGAVMSRESGDRLIWQASARSLTAASD